MMEMDLEGPGEPIRAKDVENRLNQYPLSDRGER